MKIEILYVLDCPHYPAAMAELKNVLAVERISVPISEVLVADPRIAEKLQFPGSPTIRINGRDIAGESGLQHFAVSCRLYPGEKQPGVPPSEMIHRAVREAMRREKTVKPGTGLSASLAAIVSALATMACCVPLGFAAAIGAAGASAFLLRFRPWFLLLSIALIGVGFWQQRRAKQCAVKGRFVGQFLLWTAVAIVLAMILFPQQIAGFLADHL
ncbi:MAG TPA: hypothetical protein VNX60_14430 [Candidatus Acidoferrum sp.]|nr:hypothetical protein [Candidatus Acidoferrum sp.]